MTEEQKQLHFQKLTEYINHARGYARYSGVRVTKIDDDYCEGELTITPDCCNYLGIVHGGCLATLADTVAGVAACSGGQGTVTINYGFSFLRQARGARIRCVAEAEKSGRTVKVFRCSLFDDGGELVASGQFTFFMTGPLNMDSLEQ